MLGKLFGRQPVKAWAIKQIDDATLHLCGEGTLKSDLKRKAMLEAFQLLDDGNAGEWQGRCW